MGQSEIEWLKAENARLTKQNEQLIKDLHRIDNARQVAVNQCAVMAEEVERLNGLFCDLYDVLGERGAICLSIDASNL